MSYTHFMRIAHIHTTLNYIVCHEFSNPTERCKLCVCVCLCVREPILHLKLPIFKSDCDAN